MIKSNKFPFVKTFMVRGVEVEISTNSEKEMPNMLIKEKTGGVDGFAVMKYLQDEGMLDLHFLLTNKN